MSTFLFLTVSLLLLKTFQVLFGFQDGLYNHANGHQADRLPANGGL